MWPFSRRKSEQRSIPLEDLSAAWLEFLGITGTSPAALVSEQLALKSSIAVARAASLTAGAIGVMGWKGYRTTVGGRLEIISEFLNDPSRELTAPELRERIVLDVVQGGAHYSGIERNGAGIVRYLEPIDRQLVTPRKVLPTEANPQGVLFQIGNRAYTSRDVFCVRGPSVDGINGLSLIGVARAAASGQISAEEHAHRFFDNAALLSGLLESEGDITEDQAKKLKARWKEKVAGAKNAGEVAVLGGGVKFTPLSMTHDDAQWIESRRFSSETIFSLFGLNEKGVPDNAQAWLNFTLMPYVRRVETRISRLLLPGVFCELVTETILRADIAQRYGAYAVGLQNGFLTPDYVCDAENLPRVEGGDQPKPLQPNTGTPNAHPIPAPANK